MREIRLYGSEGGGAARSPYPYQTVFSETQVVPRQGWIPARAALGRNDGDWKPSSCESFPRKNVTPGG